MRLQILGIHVDRALEHCLGVFLLRQQVVRSPKEQRRLAERRILIERGLEVRRSLLVMIEGAFVVLFDALVELVEDRLLPFLDRKSTRLNSSHPSISYAVFCLKKK